MYTWLPADSFHQIIDFFASRFVADGFLCRRLDWVLQLIPLHINAIKFLYFALQDLSCYRTDIFRWHFFIVDPIIIEPDSWGEPATPGIWFPQLVGPMFFVDPAVRETCHQRDSHVPPTEVFYEPAFLFVSYIALSSSTIDQIFCNDVAKYFTLLEHNESNTD